VRAGLLFSFLGFLREVFSIFFPASRLYSFSAGGFQGSSYTFLSTGLLSYFFASGVLRRSVTWPGGRQLLLSKRIVSVPATTAACQAQLPLVVFSPEVGRMVCVPVKYSFV